MLTEKGVDEWEVRASRLREELIKSLHNYSQRLRDSKRLGYEAAISCPEALS